MGGLELRAAGTRELRIEVVAGGQLQRGSSQHNATHAYMYLRGVRTPITIPTKPPWTMLPRR